MTIQFTIRINRWTVLAACLMAVALAVLIGPRQTAQAQPLGGQNTCPTPAPAAANTAPTPRVSPAAFQIYEHGYMIWIGDTRTLYVLYYGKDTNNGTFESFPEHWEEGMPETDPKLVPPQGMFQPTRGGGLLWRTNDKVRNGLGWGTFPPLGYMTVVAQQGDNLWFNGADRVFTLVGNEWHQHYAFNPINVP